jgi:hypothetical protein
MMTSFKKVLTAIVAVLVCGLCATSCTHSDISPAEPTAAQVTVSPEFVSQFSAFANQLKEDNTMLVYANPDSKMFDPVFEIVANVRVQERMEIIAMGMALAGKVSKKLKSGQIAEKEVCRTTSAMAAAGCVKDILDAGGCARVCKQSNYYVIYQ